MSKIVGEFLASRPRQIQFKVGKKAGETVTVYQVAFIPAADPHKFPSVMNVTESVFNQLQGVARGTSIELEFMLNPFNDEKTAIELRQVGARSA